MYWKTTVMCYKCGQVVCLSTQRFGFKLGRRSWSWYLIWHWYWLVPGSGTPRLHAKCSTDWAIQLPDTLSRLYWLSPNRDIHPHKLEICHRISEQSVFSDQPNLHARSPVGRQMSQGEKNGAQTQDPSLTERVLYHLSFPAAWHIISPIVTVP